jgi:aryl-alcohol dehydrogenase-like predicted oxidoreductase
VDTKFPEGDFRNNYFAGDRLESAVKRVEKIREEFADTGLTMPQLALKFGLQHEAVSTVIAGVRNIEQAEKNVAVSDLPDLPDDVMKRLHKHEWRRFFWYAGK